MRDDLRAAFRSLRSSPTFTVVALTVLSLGVGAAIALYAVVDAVVLRGLPFDEHDRLMAVLEYDTTAPTTFGAGNVTPQTYLDWAEQQQVFTGLAAVGTTVFRVRTEAGEPGDLRGLWVAGPFFDVFRAPPALGRALTAADGIDGQHRRIVISYGYWQRRFGGSPAVLGQTIELNEEPWEIVGVAARDFAYPVGAARPTEAYAPALFREADRVRKDSRNFNWTAIGRLRPGVTRAQAQDQMHLVSSALDAAYPKWGPGRRARVITLHDHIVGRARAWMLMLLGAVALLLVIACANVANLLLARATARARDVGIRAALGAGRWRVIRGLLVEAFVLAGAASAVGVALAYGAVALLTRWLPTGLPRVADIAIDWRVLAASVGAALATGLVFGLVPALHASRSDLLAVLREGGRGATAGAGQRLRHLLVVMEVALAVVLLVGAGLFVGSFAQLVRIDPGFDYRNVLTLNVAVRIPPAATPDALKKAFADARLLGRPYIDRMIAAVGAVPGVTHVAGVQEGVPLSGGWSRSGITLPGGELRSGPDDNVDRNTVTANYFEVLRIPVKRGRLLTPADTETSPRVVVINESAAAKYWPGADALGQRFTMNEVEWTVVGVVGDVRHLGLESPSRQAVYLPYTQEGPFGMNLLIRTAGDPLRVLAAVKAAIWSVNRDQRLTQEVVSLEGHMDRLIAQRRFNMALLVLFGALGLVITIAGIYGVMAYAVEQRTPEIGVRMALGATPREVLRMVLTTAGGLLVVGLVVGSLAAWQLSSTVQAFLFQTEPTDMRTFAAALALLAAAGLAASAIPATRAARVDPVTALRRP